MSSLNSPLESAAAIPAAVESALHPLEVSR